MKLGLFIDYHNVSERGHFPGILDVVTKALVQLRWSSQETRGNCDVRIYGGWYEGSSMTQLAQSVTASVQQDFPTLIKLTQKPGQTIDLSTTAELAVSLLEEPGHHLLDTYRKKGRPGNVRVQDPASIGCVSPQCPLPTAKKLLKTGRCPIDTCVVGPVELVYRHEQKIVDTMLSCDLLYAANRGYDRLLLISGDDDFLAPMRIVSLRGTQVIRFHPQPNNKRASFPPIGAPLIELDL